jgi:hypothetical protein
LVSGGAVFGRDADFTDAASHLRLAIFSAASLASSCTFDTG